MKRKAYVIFWAVLTLIISCKDKKSTNAGEKKKARIVMAMARTFYPSRYTGGKWLNGINVEEKKQFFLQVAKNVPAPIQAGYRLKFAAAGIATVQNIFRLEKNEHSFIFVRLDKQLDPSKDGFPFPIYFYGCTIKPSAYSDGKK